MTSKRKLRVGQIWKHDCGGHPNFGNGFFMITKITNTGVFGIQLKTGGCEAVRTTLDEPRNKNWILICDVKQ